MLEVERCYRILEVEPGASLEEVRQGYLDLIWVWHPDRFAGNPRLQKKAHGKLQELNEAHERLRSFLPKPQKRNLQRKSKSQMSPSPQTQTSTHSMNQSKVHQSVDRDNRAKSKDSKPNTSYKTRDVGEWLD
jgi:DnaJ-class molecular chaperone